MNIFLNFTFDPEKLRHHLKKPWMTVYDHLYIEETIIGGIEKHIQIVDDIIK